MELMKSVCFEIRWRITLQHSSAIFFLTAISDFQKAIDIDNNNNKASEGVKRAQKLLKQSQKRDYYKILGVKR